MPGGLAIVHFDPEDDFDTPLEVFAILMTRYVNTRRQRAKAGQLTTYVAFTFLSKFTDNTQLYIKEVCEHLGDWVMYNDRGVSINPLKLPQLTMTER